MSGQSEDDAWRSIVENYGERPAVEPVPDPIVEPVVELRRPAYDEVLDESADSVDPWEDEGFVPPPTPPVPVPPPNRLVAWLGLFGSPTLLLLALLTGIDIPGWVAYGLVAWFVGGFVYLVWLMDRGPRDPGDDGARL